LGVYANHGGRAIGDNCRPRQRNRLSLKSVKIELPGLGSPISFTDQKTTAADKDL